MKAPIRVLFALPGLHRVVRGAEVAFESIAFELARAGRFDVTLIGSGRPRPGAGYRFLHAGCRPRERFEGWPTFPIFRSENVYEEFTFLPGFLRRFVPSRYDAVVTCSYPFLNWAVRARRAGGARPIHLFVTQNGDWPLRRSGSEYAWFGCDAAVCINPEHYEAHAGKWPLRLIPNGVDCAQFHPGSPERTRFGLPPGRPVVLMVSALIPSKRVLEGIRAVAQVPDAHLVVAGDGPLRDAAEHEARAAMPGRFHRLAVARADMPALYRSADAFLHMSMDEPFGIVYLEALASGLPVVAHDRRVTRWTLDRYGTFVDTQDLPAVARAVRGAVADRVDPAGPAAYARARFSWSSIAAEYGAFISEQVGRR